MSKKLFVSTDGVTKSQLMEVMKFHLNNFNDEGVTINNDTIHNSVLSDSDGVTSQTSSKNIYKGIIRWTMNANGHEDKPWPLKWMEQSVDELSTAII
ncbi:hypothetical protein [Flavisolibacter ginsenosidimutans]|uniref:Uncharacterized protein n=1 Tax=Flavisolibacter ginsenosidimutans TaxID=661481 RepID=A0A5B8UJA5_9BACT|nr:hypothetical protein [Flavisolibacter ginsenosidimutans]QEC56648.1 hypothetical protein FSB75_12330 [Flavisolibacter ginsenosidimutans]